MEIRPYQHRSDFDRINQFLIEAYQPGDVFDAWLQPRWEYMHFHPSILSLDRSRFGIAEEGGQIRGIVHSESNPAEVFIQVHPEYVHLKESLFDFAEETNYQGLSKSTGRLFRVVYVNDFDTVMEALVVSRGYERWDHFAEKNSRYLLNNSVPQPELPDGFRLQCLADENDLHKINRVLWRGFNHQGPPPEEEVEGRSFGQQAPNFRKDLTIVAVAPDGTFVSYCGMWYIPRHKVAYLEPLATDPEFRRMGLAKAVVFESMRRVQNLGAELVWVGSGLEFYQAIGFQLMFAAYPWAIFLD